MTEAHTALQEKLSAFAQAETDLARSLAADLGTQTRDAERRLSELHHAICRYRSNCPSEIGAQIRFLVDRIIKQSADGAQNIDYIELCNVVANMIGENTRSCPDPMPVIARQSETDSDSPLDWISVSGLVARACDRMTVIGTDYRYLQSNSPYCDFYNDKPEKIVGKHISDVIGEARFSSRARHRLDACFNHGTQEYDFALDVAGQTRIMNIRMLPVRDRYHVSIGALVMIRDTTTNSLDLTP